MTRRATSRRTRDQPDTSDVRAYFGGRHDSPPGARVRVHVSTGWRPDAQPVASLLLAGFRDVEPRSVVAEIVAARVLPRLDGALGVVLYCRDTRTGLANWLRRELIATTSVERVNVHRLDRDATHRDRRPGR